MNPMTLLMASACVAGADATPPVVYAPTANYAAPVAHGPLVSQGSGCTNCGAAPQSYSHAHYAAPTASYSSCCESERPGLFDRLRSLCHKDDACEPACDACSTPVFTGFTTAAPCDDCCEPAGEKHGLFARLKAKFGRHHGCDTCDAPTCCEATPACCGDNPAGPTGCSLPPVPGTVYPATPTVAPQMMPVAPESAPMSTPTPAPMPAPATETAPVNPTGISIPSVVTPVSGGLAPIPTPLPASKF